MENQIIPPQQFDESALQIEENFSKPPSNKFFRLNKKNIIIIAVTVIVLVLGGGGYWAYSHGYVSIPFLTPNRDQLIERFINSFSNIDNAKYAITFSAKANERESKYSSIFDAQKEAGSNINALNNLAPYGFGDMDSIFKTFPSDLDLTLNTGFYLETDVDPKDANFQWQLGGSYTGGDMTVQADLEIRKIAENFYGVIRKFPGLFFIDVSTIKDKWVEITPEDGIGEMIDSSYSNLKQDEAVKQISDGLKSAFDSGLLKLSAKKSDEVITGVKSEHYAVVINPDAISETYQGLINAMKARNADTKKIEESLNEFNEFIKDEANKTMLDNAISNTNVDVWIDKVNGFIRQAKLEFILVPPETVEGLKGKQLNLNLIVTLDNINDKFDVAKPNPTISYSEAERLISGISEAEQKFNKQRSRIEDIRTALNKHKTDRGQYPNSLADMKKEMPALKDACEQRKKESEEANKAIDNTNSSLGLNLGSYVTCYNYKDSVSIIDIFTDEEFIYTVKDDNFELVYRMEIPEDKQDSYYAERYIEGKNTATKDDYSLEKENTGITFTEPDIDQLYTNTNTNTSLPSTVTTIDVKDTEHIRGNVDASITIVEYSDLQCPYCSKFHVTMEQILEEYPNDVRWVFRHYPLNFHPLAKKSAEASECANDQGKFWEYVDKVYLNQSSLTDSYLSTVASEINLDTALFQTCLSEGKYTTAIDTYIENAGVHKITGTPTTFINNQVVNGAVPYTQVKSMIDNLLQDSGTENIDTDGDGMTDDMEQAYGTNINLSDTDGDGYSDWTEVRNGYNPLGDGLIDEN